MLPALFPSTGTVRTDLTTRLHEGRNMGDAEFKELVREMRDQQKHYFKHRDNLDRCRELERRVDEALKGPTPRTLFDAPEESPP